jgi:signal transduction histidine kinase
LQAGLVTATQWSMPEMDFIPSLFYPLCYQAVLFCGRRTGYRWIAVFVVLLAGPLLVGWEFGLPGIATVLIDGCACFLVGSYAHLILRAEQSSRENQKLAGEVQVAYSNLQDQAAQIEEYAIQQERGRMARELHDSVTQTIFSMNLTVQTARMLAAKDLSLVGAQLDRLQTLARSAIGEIQVLVDQLRPGPLVADNLPASLRNLVVERNQQDGMQIDLQVNGERQLPQAVIVGLFRIVQEALNNIVKHAGTREGCIRLDLESQPASLEVEDRGCGFEPDKTVRDIQHIGLSGMAERAREFGWRLSVESQPGQGTRILVLEGLVQEGRVEEAPV